MGGSKQNNECCCTITQDGSSEVNQNQDVAQSNISQQDVAIAVAVGEGSVARACQIAFQTNENTQSGTASSHNAGFVESCCAPPQQNALASVFPVQNVQQNNNSIQTTAVAISIDGGEASFLQMAAQTNINAQGGSAGVGSDNNCPLVADGGENRKKDQKSNPREETTTFLAWAEAISDQDEKAAISIEHGGQRVKIQIKKNGDVLINNQLIMNLK